MRIEGENYVIATYEAIPLDELRRRYADGLKLAEAVLKIESNLQNPGGSSPAWKRLVKLARKVKGVK